MVAVARACSSAALQNCGCDEKIYKMRKPRQLYKENYGYIVGKQSGSYSKEGAPNVQNMFSKNDDSDQPVPWKWGGCSHNLKYGVRFSKMFLDSREKADDIHSKTNLHNNQVGRMVRIRFMRSHNSEIRPWTVLTSRGPQKQLYGSRRACGPRNIIIP